MGCKYKKTRRFWRTIDKHGLAGIEHFSTKRLIYELEHYDHGEFKEINYTKCCKILKDIVTYRILLKQN